MLRLLLIFLLIILSGCENPFQSDADTSVTIVITGANRAGEEKLREKLVELVRERSSWSSSNTSYSGKTIYIVIDPVKDVKDFANRITFGKITAIDDCINSEQTARPNCSRKIHVKIGNDQ